MAGKWKVRNAHRPTLPTTTPKPLQSKTSQLSEFYTDSQLVQTSYPLRVSFGRLEPSIFPWHARNVHEPYCNRLQSSLGADLPQEQFTQFYYNTFDANRQNLAALYVWQLPLPCPFREAAQPTDVRLAARKLHAHVRGLLNSRRF